MEVYVKTHAGTTVDTYHTHEDCPWLSLANDYRTAPLEALFDDVTLCSECAKRNGEAGGP